MTNIQFQKMVQALPILFQYFSSRKFVSVGTDTALMCLIVIQDYCEPPHRVGRGSSTQGGRQDGSTSCSTEWTTLGTAPARVYGRHSGVSSTPGPKAPDHRILPIRTPRLETLSSVNCIVQTTTE